MDTKEKYEFSKIYLSEYCHFDGEDEHDFSFIVDACGKFEKLWQFSSFLV